MQRVPVIVATAVALFVVACLAEASAQGLAPPLEWDLQHAWWKSDFLAAVGWWLAVPALFAVRITAGRSVFLLTLVVTVVSIAAVVYYATRILLHGRKA